MKLQSKCIWLLVLFMGERNYAAFWYWGVSVRATNMLHMGKEYVCSLMLDHVVFNLGSLSKPQISFFTYINLENQQDIEENQWPYKQNW